MKFMELNLYWNLDYELVKIVFGILKGWFVIEFPFYLAVFCGDSKYKNGYVNINNEQGNIN